MCAARVGFHIRAGWGPYQEKVFGLNRVPHVQKQKERKKFQELFEVWSVVSSALATVRQSVC